MSDRCTGHCCEVFHLPKGPAGLAERATYDPDVARVQQIVQYLGFGYTKEFISSRVPTIPEHRRLDREKGHWYTCTVFDKETRNCTDYENRPHMCRDYPGVHRCEHLDCTWDEVTQRPCTVFTNPPRRKSDLLTIELRSRLNDLKELV